MFPTESTAAVVVALTRSRKMIGPPGAEVRVCVKVENAFSVLDERSRSDPYVLKLDPSRLYVPRLENGEMEVSARRSTESTVTV